MVGVEPEIIKRAEANRIGVLISPKRFCAPCDKVRVRGINIPWCAAIPGVSYSAIVREAGMLRRGMKFDVADIDPSSYRHAERLNRAIEVLVIKRVLIVPDASRWVGHLVTDEENAVAVRWGSRSWLDLIYRCARPGFNGWLLSHGRANRAKTEIRRPATHGVLLIRGVVVHVALVRMSLAPGAFMRDDIFRFGKIGRARIPCRNQVTGLHQNPVRSCVMTVAGVIVRCST